MRILIISEYIAPLASIASIRWTKIAKYLKEATNGEIEIVVLTTKKNFDNPNSILPLEKKDTSLEGDMDAFDEYWDMPLEDVFQWMYTLKRKLTGSVNTPFHKEEGQADSGGKSSWRSRVSELLSDLAFEYRNEVIGRKASDFVLDKGEYFDAVISSLGPIWPHMVATRMKKAGCKVFWLADFRDTYAQPFYSNIIQWRHKYLAHKYTKKADYISAVSDLLITNASSRIPRSTVTNGFDPQDALEPLAPCKFSIVFTGTLYGELQNFCILFQAINELLTEGWMQADDVEVIYAGASSVFATDFARRENAIHYFRDMGFVSREKALALQQNAAILLQACWCINYDNNGNTGKMYEYMMARKPLVFIVNGNSPHSATSKTVPLLGGYCYENCRHEETYSGLKQYILDKYNEWKQTGNVTIQRDDAYVEQFSYLGIANQVLEILNQNINRA